MSEGTSQNSKLILAAMIFAVSMTFIDQTIVAIAIPTPSPSTSAAWAMAA